MVALFDFQQTLMAYTFFKNVFTHLTEDENNWLSNQYTKYIHTFLYFSWKRFIDLQIQLGMKCWLFAYNIW